MESPPTALIDSLTRPDPEALLDPGTSLNLPASKLLSLRLPPAPSGLRLGLAPSLPVGAGCLHVAVGASGGEPVAAASIPAKFLRTLHLAAVPASLHAIALLSLFFTFSRGKRACSLRPEELEEIHSCFVDLLETRLGFIVALSNNVQVQLCDAFDVTIKAIRN